MLTSQNEFYALISEKMRAAIRLTLVAIMDAEVEAFVGAPHGLPSATQWDYRYTRDLVTTADKVTDSAAPRTRGLSDRFRPQVFEQSQRRQRELHAAIGAMFVKGIRLVGVGEIRHTLTGEQPSPSRCRGSITACKPNTRRGRRAACLIGMSTCLPMGRISA